MRLSGPDPRGKTKVWLFLGWRTENLFVYFESQPSARAFDRKGKDVTTDVELSFSGNVESLSRPVVRELYVSKILDRSELREHCDRFKTERAITEHL